jgi:hypothetical protein
MKKVTLILLICIWCVQMLHAQAIKDSIPTSKMSNNELSMQYLHKGKGLVLAGFILTGVGVAATIVGSNGTRNHYNLFTGEGGGYLLLWGFGIGTIAAGIPITISGFLFKRKARLVLRNDNVFRDYHVPINANLLSVGIAVALK